MQPTQAKDFAAADLGVLADGKHRIAVCGQPAFVKIRRDRPRDFFAAEARGLAALARAGALRVPAVLALDEFGIALEDLGSGEPQRHDWEQAGCALATLHHTTQAQFGFEHDGWCGDSAQSNAWDADGFRFFTEQRLLPQAKRAFDHRLLERSDVIRIESVCAQLRELLPERPPVLVHGDLWLGNLHACTSGELALIDGGAVHHGWAEGDLAMLTLFGEPPLVFFAAYAAAAGIDSSWRTRAPLLNLYHLLNHLNLFGGTYRAAVRGVLARVA
jgi:fructosamine-3-kinase